MKDKIIMCVQCQSPFVFSGAEQERFLARGFDVPKRCPDCRERKSRTFDTDGRWKEKGRHRRGWNKAAFQ